MTEKRPRQYNAAIQALPMRDERLKALGDVPEHLQPWVKDLLNDAIKYGDSKRKAQLEAKQKRGTK